MSDQTPPLPVRDPELPPEQEPEKLWGYSPEQLKRMGMGFLLQPPHEQTTPIKPLSTGLRIDPDEPLEPLDDEPASSQVIDLPASTVNVQPIPAALEIQPDSNEDSPER